MTLNQTFLQQETFGATHRLEDILRETDTHISDLANHAKYTRVSESGDSAEFRLADKNGESRATITVAHSPEHIEDGVIRISVEFFQGETSELYWYNKTFPSAESNRDICSPYNCPNVMRIPALKDLLSDFMLSVQNSEDTAFHKKH